MRAHVHVRARYLLLWAEVALTSDATLHFELTSENYFNFYEHKNC